jgi:hypothetical protein
LKSDEVMDIKEKPWCVSWSFPRHLSWFWQVPGREKCLEPSIQLVADDPPAPMVRPIFSCNYSANRRRTHCALGVNAMPSNDSVALEVIVEVE